VLGTGAKSPLASGDAVADRAAVRHFVELADQGHALLAPRENTRTLVVGSDPRPFPIPLVKAKAGWTFDTQAGQTEILARRMGQNELDAIQVCLGYVGAQREYLARNPEGASAPHYAELEAGRALLSSGSRRTLLARGRSPPSPSCPYPSPQDLGESLFLPHERAVPPPQRRPGPCLR
jgi:hypothetical protein